MAKKGSVEQEKAQDYMKRKVHRVPDRSAPPAQLFTMIGAFLTEHGFDTTSRIFDEERRGRQQITGYEHGVGDELERGTPGLESIYKVWHKEWKAGKANETSGEEIEGDTEDSEPSESDAASPKKVEASSSSDDDSEPGSDGFGSLDLEMKDAPKAQKKAKAARKASPFSSTSPSSDSDADDEEDPKPTKATFPKRAASRPTTAAMKPTAATLNNVLKRKAPSSSDSSDSDGSSSETSEDEKPSQPKKARVEPNPENECSVGSSSSSSSFSSSESDSGADKSQPLKKSSVKSKISPANVPLPESSSDQDDSDESSSASSDDGMPTLKQPAAKSLRIELTQTKNKASTSNIDYRKSSTESSVTINGDSKKPSTSPSGASASSATSSSSSSESDSDQPSHQKNSSELPAKVPLASQPIRNHQGAKPTPLAEISAKVDPNSYLSNTYVPYSYADKAYQDLSITRGKGFTKEKNKKKRGSYRGGTIDIGGGKGFRFQD